MATALVASADAAATTTVEKTIEKSDGSVVRVTEKVRDPAAAEMLRQTALHQADVQLTEIERTLDDRLAALANSNILEITTVPPGGAYGGTVITARPKGPGDVQALSLQVTLNGEAHDFNFAVEPVR